MTIRTEHTQARTLGVWLGAFTAMLLAVVLWAVPGSDAQGDTIVINEFQPKNATTLFDGEGDTPDWIELHNVTDAPIDISGWTIADGSDELPRIMPIGTVIDADGYLIIYASGKGTAGPAGEIHTDFKLGGSGDTIILVGNFITVDSVTYDRPFIDDESQGRNAAGVDVIFAPGSATPGTANGAGSAPTPTPTITPTAPLGDPSIVFNEVMQANTATIQDESGAGDFEDWFELYNPTCETIDLTGWTIRDSVNVWAVPDDTTMAPNDVLFVWASGKGDDPPAGEIHTNFRLSAPNGEAMFLINPAGEQVATVNAGPSQADESYALTTANTYVVQTGAAVSPGVLNPGQVPTDCTPTPTPTPSATPIPSSTPTPTPTLLPGEPTPTPTPIPSPTATPLPSPTPTVTPTAAPTPTATSTPTVAPTPTATATPSPIECADSIVINEAQTRNTFTIFDGDGDSSDWIELYNPTNASVDLSGWIISDAGNSFTLAAGTSIPSNGYLLIWASDKGDPDDADFPGPVGEIHTDYRLSGSGESISLFDATRCRVAALSVPLLDSDQSFGTTLDNTLGVFNFGWPTPGAPNGRQFNRPIPQCYAPESPVRINRIVAKNDGILLDGDGDESDFIELYNTGFDPVNLVFHEFSDGSDRWTIPDNAVIDGYGTLIIWASGKGDPTDGDFPGPAGELHTNFKLSSDGEEISFGIGVCTIERLAYPALTSNQAYGYDAEDQLHILMPGASTAECAAPGSVQIVAVQAKNDSTRADEDGDFGDWLELRTTTDETIDLTGWVLADDGDAWVVPEGVSIEPGTDLVVWADEKNRGGADQAVHTNFKLGGDGETLSLGSSLDCPVDLVTYPALDDDQTYRRGSEGAFAVEGGAAEKDEEKKDDVEAPGDVTIVGTCVAINEIMAKNDSTLEDEDGEFGDWIELVNLGEDTIDLSGYVIGDEEDTWTIPDGVEIEAGAFLLLWADEGDRGEAGEELHTNFKLGGGGEPVTLTTADGDIAASLSTYPELEDDESFGVDDDGNYVVRAVGDATPGEGPAPTSGCDFEVGSAAATAGDADDDSDAGVSDGADSSDSNGDSDADGQTDADADADAASGESASDTTLATTGTSASRQALFAQTLVIAGMALVAIARISHRRSQNS